MQTHIEKAYRFLDNHLPSYYTEAVQEILKKGKIIVSDDVIRNVRLKKSSKNIAVLNALLTVAKRHQKSNQILEIQLQEQI
jgi:predicted O-methyltransferase YrrM